VDERSIVDVRPDDVRGYTQCHFFAGIGGWSYALRLAGWPDDQPVWTGSCPCQPFSQAGVGGGFTDKRHLWPAFFHLIQQCSAERVFGEQVGAKAGENWLDLVFDDLEGSSYACAAADLAAASVGAPHIRQRLYWVADSEVAQRRRTRFPSDTGRRSEEAGGSVRAGGVADIDNQGLEGRDGMQKCADEFSSGANQLAGGMEYPNLPGKHKWTPSGEQPLHNENGSTSPWGDIDWIHCRDGKARPVEAGTFPLANGVLKRMGKLRGFGNAIVPQVAAEFIKSYMEAVNV
jgi:DNA (cytosine-5)-methyltransferase 1